MPTADRARFMKCLYLLLRQIIAFLSIAKMYCSDRLPSISISNTRRKTKTTVLVCRVVSVFDVLFNSIATNIASRTHKITISPQGRYFFRYGNSALRSWLDLPLNILDLSGISNGDLCAPLKFRFWRDVCGVVDPAKLA